MGYRIKAIRVLNPEKLNNDRCVEQGWICIVGVNEGLGKRLFNKTLQLASYNSSVCPSKLSRIRKECKRRGIEIELEVEFYGLKPSLKPYQDSYALERRRLRKEDKDYCDRMRKLGEYRNKCIKLVKEYKDQGVLDEMIDFHIQAFGILAPFIMLPGELSRYVESQHE